MNEKQKEVMLCKCYLLLGRFYTMDQIDEFFEIYLKVLANYNLN